MVNSKSGIQTSINNRIFWRIVFDVADGGPRLWQEFTCWNEYSQPPFVRANRVARRLTILESPGVTFGKDNAEFTDGYIKSETIALNEFECFGPTGVAGERSEEDRLGQNISFLALVQTETKDNPTIFPIFHLEQPSRPNSLVRPVSLVLHASRGANSFTWNIADQAYRSDSYQLDGNDRFHRLRVDQGRSNHSRRSSRKNVFDMRVDNIPVNSFIIRNRLNQNDLNDPTFHFDTSSVTFYIGASYDASNQEISRGFTGKIERLEFDPNSSCGGCARYMKLPTQPGESE